MENSLSKVIDNLSENIQPTPEQQSLLDFTRQSLLEKMKNGQQFHSVQLNSRKEIEIANPTNPNRPLSRIEPDQEPLMARGVLVKNLNENELTLAKEVFGVVVKSNDEYLLPIDMKKKSNAQKVLENVELLFSKAINNNPAFIKILPPLASLGGTIGGAASLINTHGMRVLLTNITAKFAGGAMITPGLLPVLGGAAAIGAAVGAAYAVSPLAKKLNQVRQSIRDKLDGDELVIASNAVEKINYATIVSTKRSNLLPSLEAEVEERVVDSSRVFAKSNKR